MADLLNNEQTSESASTKAPLKICHIIFRLDVGGLENGLVNLINFLPAASFRHSIVCLKYASEFRYRIQRDDVELFELHKKDGKDISIYWKMWRLLRQIRPDIVHTRNVPTIDMLPIAMLAGIKRRVHSEHGLDFMEKEGNHSKYNKIRRLSRFFARHYITVSNELADWLRCDIGIRGDRISAIHNGVPSDRFYPGNAKSAVLPADFAGKDTLVIGTIGRIARIKDQMNLARAFAVMLDKAPTWKDRARLVIVGDGDQKSAIDAFLKERNLQHLCWLPGYRDDTGELYRAFDLFVLPSQREGISNTILEAMACGLPVLATRVGGNPEIVDDGVTGTLVPPSDPQSMAGALLNYLENPAVLRTHGEAARARVLREFSMDAMVRNYTRVYLQT